MHSPFSSSISNFSNLTKMLQPSLSEHIFTVRSLFSLLIETWLFAIIHGSFGFCFVRNLMVNNWWWWWWEWPVCAPYKCYGQHEIFIESQFASLHCVLNVLLDCLKYMYILHGILKSSLCIRCFNALESSSLSRPFSSQAGHMNNIFLQYFHNKSLYKYDWKITLWRFSESIELKAFRNIFIFIKSLSLEILKMTWKLRKFLFGFRFSIFLFFRTFFFMREADQCRMSNTRAMRACVNYLGCTTIKMKKKMEKLR